MSFEDIGREVGRLVDMKNQAHGSSFTKVGSFLRILYPDGVSPDQYTDMLLIVRIFDKLMRIANEHDAFEEHPYKDLAGYGILGLSIHGKGLEEWVGDE